MIGLGYSPKFERNEYPILRKFRLLKHFYKINGRYLNFYLNSLCEINTKKVNCNLLIQ